MSETGEVSSTDAITTNIHTCLWRLQQGAWYTTNPTEVANLKSTGFKTEAYLAVGVLAALDKDADTRNLLRELLRTMLSAGEVSHTDQPISKPFRILAIISFLRSCNLNIFSSRNGMLECWNHGS
jgi:hypothetical protein